MPGADTHLPMPAVGAAAPEIDAVASSGERFVLSEQRGTWVVIYFFVRSDTPG